MRLVIRGRPIIRRPKFATLTATLLAGAALLGFATGAGNATDQGPPRVTLLDQGWPDELRTLYYFTPQGSRMIPYAWFMALETPEAEGLFSDTENLLRYGLIAADGPSVLNPDALPIGFAIDPVEVPGRGRHLGLTCAVCHTSEIEVDGRRVRIDGGAAHFDFDSFYQDLAAAVEHALFDPAAFQRFAGRVLSGASEAELPQQAEALKARLAMYQAEIAGDATIRRPALASGFGRVDALTQILNALAATNQGDPTNLRSVEAPTSYPHLWLAPRLEFVQWNPIAASPIGRNGGEVLGVFGMSILSGADTGQWYSSSILLRELAELEGWIETLQPPPWDEAILGPIDRDLATRGEALFREHCAACHTAEPYDLTPAEANHFGKQFIRIAAVEHKEVGTDPTYVESLARRLVRVGPAMLDPLGGKPVVPAAEFFATSVGAIVRRSMAEAGLNEAEKAALGGFRLRPPASAGVPPAPYVPASDTALKAGPLDGIWASGPYLHNGSVPTIYELLSPQRERRAVFWTGGRELDRKWLGFVSDKAPKLFRFNTKLPGNRNIGHLYPEEGLTPDERMAVIEFLKTQ